MTITITDYITQARTFIAVPPENLTRYLARGLKAEIGELNGLFAKQLRGDINPGDLLSECGDVLWFALILWDRHLWDDHTEWLNGLMNPAPVTLLPVDKVLDEMTGSSALVYNAIRPNHPTDRDELFKSLGRIAYDVRIVLATHELSIAEALEANLTKLANRQANNQIKSNDLDRALARIAELEAEVAELRGSQSVKVRIEGIVT